MENSKLTIVFLLLLLASPVLSQDIINEINTWVVIGALVLIGGGIIVFNWICVMYCVCKTNQDINDINRSLKARQRRFERLRQHQEPYNKELRSAVSSRQGNYRAVHSPAYGERSPQPVTRSAPPTPMSHSRSPHSNSRSPHDLNSQTNIPRSHSHHHHVSFEMDRPAGPSGFGNRRFAGSKQKMPGFRSNVDDRSTSTLDSQITQQSSISIVTPNPRVVVSVSRPQLQCLSEMEEMDVRQDLSAGPPRYSVLFSNYNSREEYRGQSSHGPFSFNMSRAADREQELGQLTSWPNFR